MIIIALLATVFLYLLFPVSYVIVKGKTTQKKASKLALINSVVCAAAVICFAVIADVASSFSTSMFAPAFLYYFINKRIMTDKTLEECEKKDPDSENENEGNPKDSDNDNNFKNDDDGENLKF